LLAGTSASIQASNLIPGRRLRFRSGHGEEVGQEGEGKARLYKPKTHARQGGCRPATMAARRRTLAKARAACRATTAARCRKRSPLNQTLEQTLLSCRGAGEYRWPSFLFCFGWILGMPAIGLMGLRSMGLAIGLASAALQSHFDTQAGVRLVRDNFENFMIDGGGRAHSRSNLEQYKSVQHGVSMYFGSAEKANREHLRR